MAQALNILILEDEPTDVELIKRDISNSDLRVDKFWVARGRDEFHAALAQGPDVILADYSLPAYSAWQALETARAQAPDCPFVVTSGALGDETAADLIKQGADDYLLKDRLARLPVAITHALERRRAETEKQEVQRALRDSEQRHRHIVETTLEGIWLVDASAHVTFANRRVIELLGYPSEQMRGRPFWSFVHPADQAKAAQWLERSRREIKVQDDLRLRTHDGQQLWVICSIKPMFDDDGAFTGALVMVADITARKDAEDALRHAAFHDCLTGLVKRDLFVDRLGQALQRARRRADCTFAVFFIDVDRFKEINDTLGHHCGDQLLRVIAERLDTTLRTSDSLGRLRQDEAVARVGGDEFTAVLTDMHGAADATAAAERIQKAIYEPVELGSRQVTTSISIGIALYAPHYESADELLRDADTALYRAKARGDGRCEVWDAQMGDEAQRQFELGQQIHRAPDQNELRMWYQPIIALDTGQPVGCEALMRWAHPERGMVSPGEFIPLAEETGAIVAMGAWALRQACRQLLEWDWCFPNAPPLYVSVNISRRQLAQADFPEQVAAIFRETGVDPARVKFEITESAVIDESGASKTVLNNLIELGVPLYMDDFGTGYSSLSYLYELPINVLKIDRSFTQQIDQSAKQRSIVRSIIGLAHNIGIPVIAEGVETVEQAERLLIKGCEYGQGFLFSRPLAPDDLTCWLETRFAEAIDQPNDARSGQAASGSDGGGVAPPPASATSASTTTAGDGSED